MKAKKLLERVKQFLDSDRQTQLDKIKSIRKVLKELKQKERDLREDLDKEKDPSAIENLQLKLDVIYAQRKKGLDRVQELKEGLKPKQESVSTDWVDQTDTQNVAQDEKQEVIQEGSQEGSQENTQEEPQEKTKTPPN